MSTSPEAGERERARRERRRELVVTLSEAVAELGFRKKGDVYLAPLAPGVHRWLGLQVVRDGDLFSVAPNVGVRHDELQLVVAHLHGRKPQPTPTLVRMLGYLMPQRTANVVWEFHAHDDPEWTPRSANLAGHIEQYAFPWMNRYQTLDDILAGLDEGLSLYEAELRPAALLLLGRRDDALRQIEEAVLALGDRADPAAENYRRFANALRGESETE